MNLYDTRPINCIMCGKFIGEMECNSKIVLPRCGDCSRPKPEGDDVISYLERRFENTVKNLVEVY